MGLLSVTVSPHPRVTRRATRRRPGPAHGTGQWIGHLASSPHQCPAAVKAMVTLAALPPAITAGRSKTSPPVAARRLKTAAAGRPHSPSPQFWPTGLNAGLLYAELGYALRASAGPARTQTWAAAPAGRPQAGQPDAIRQQLGDAAGARNGDDRPDPAAGQRQPLPRSICRGIVRHATHDYYFPPFPKRNLLARDLRPSGTAEGYFAGVMPSTPRCPRAPQEKRNTGPRAGKGRTAPAGIKNA